MPALVILAAGMGSRYGGLKQLDAVDDRGQTILEYSVYDALKAGFDKLVFVIRRDFADRMDDVFGARFKKRSPVSYVFQEIDALPPGFSVPPARAKPWGTGHAVMVCADAVKEPFCVVNADDFYGNAAYEAMAGFLKDKSGSSGHYSMVGFLLENTLSENGPVSRGVCEVSSGGGLISVTERTNIERLKDGGIFYKDAGNALHPLSGKARVSLNFWGFTPDFFNDLETQFAGFLEDEADDPKAEFFLPSAVDLMIREGRARVTVLESRDRWVGVTYRQDKDEVCRHIEALVSRGAYPKRLFAE